MPKRYNLDTVDNSIKVIGGVDSYKTYEGVITRCIGYNNNVILKEVLNCTDFNHCKMKLVDNSKIQMFLIDYALRERDTTIVKLIFSLYDIKYENEYDNLISKGKLVYYDNCLINTLKDFDYIINHFEDLTGEPLLVYDECVSALENYMGEKLSEEYKNILKSVISETQEKMYNVRQEMSDMDDRMYEEWYSWRTDANYHSYDSYPITVQIEIWENFKSYYENVNIESESEYEEEDYDY
jgi:hypothetical protein